MKDYLLFKLRKKAEKTIQSLEDKFPGIKEKIVRGVQKSVEVVHTGIETVEDHIHDYRTKDLNKMIVQFNGTPVGRIGVVPDADDADIELIVTSMFEVRTRLYGRKPTDINVIPGNDKHPGIINVVFDPSTVSEPVKVSHIFRLIDAANPHKNLKNIERRFIKLAEEKGEAAEAYLNVSNVRNPKNKTWGDFREEMIDTIIISVDLAMTELPTDAGKSKDQILDEMMALLDKKLTKWINNREKDVTI